MQNKKKFLLTAYVEPLGLTIENITSQTKNSCDKVLEEFPPESCKECPSEEGYYSNEFGQAECKQCASGKTVDKKIKQQCMIDERSWLTKFNRTKDINTGDEVCVDCLDFTSKCTDALYCSDCPTGTAGENGRCDPCKAGRYINAEGQTTCLECPVGEYQDQSSQTECKKCNNGTMSSVAGGTNEIQCSDCLSGQYQAAEGQASCVGCPTGQSQPGLGKTACVPCVAGTYGPSTGLNEW